MTRLVAALSFLAACGQPGPSPASAPELQDGSAPAAPPPPPSRPTPTPARHATSRRAAEATGLPAGWRLPDGWIWVTETRDGYAIGLPALPRALTDAEHAQRVLSVENVDGVIRVTRAAADADPANEIRAAVAAAGTVLRSDEPFRDEGRRLELEGPSGREVAAVVPHEDGGAVLVRAATRPGRVLDVEALLTSVTTEGLLAPNVLGHAQGHFRIEAPARMDPMDDRRAEPPVRGLHGVLDGHQLGATFVPALGLPAGLPGLRAAMNAAVAAMPGVLESSEERHVGTRPELWYRCRATGGGTTAGSVRTTFVGGNLVVVAVYSPAGQEPPWAARFLASLEVEE